MKLINIQPSIYRKQIFVIMCDEAVYGFWVSYTVTERGDLFSSIWQLNLLSRLLHVLFFSSSHSMRKGFLGCHVKAYTTKREHKMQSHRWRSQWPEKIWDYSSDKEQWILLKSATRWLAKSSFGTKTWKHYFIWYKDMLLFQILYICIYIFL